MSRKINRDTNKTQKDKKTILGLISYCRHLLFKMTPLGTDVVITAKRAGVTKI